MPRNVFSTTLDANTLKALKLLAAREYRPLYEVLEEAAERYLAQKAAGDPDRQFFTKRGKEPLEDCLAAIARRIAHIKRRRAIRNALA